MFQTVVILSVFAAAFATPIAPEARIVNGTNAQLGEIPFIVSLRGDNSHRCGASILTARHVITAAHCVQNYPVENLSVQYGLLQIVEAADALNVVLADNYFVHPDYVSGNGYVFDVAVIKLKSDIIFDTNVQPVQLPHVFNNTPENSQALLSGWGYDQSGGNIMTNLQKVDIKIYTDDDCERIHAISGPTNRFNHICAGVPEGGKGQCSGDSGGPLIVDNQLVGLVSWSVKPCTRQGYPGVFTKVSNVVIWVIQQITK